MTSPPVPIDSLRTAAAKPGRVLLACALLGLVFFASGCEERRWFAEDRVYESPPDPSCNGTPTNPDCVVRVSFHPDGRMERNFDDIIASGDYWIVDRTVTLEVDNFDFHAELELSEDEMMLGDMIRIR